MRNKLAKTGVKMTDGEYLRAERIAIKVASGIPEPEAIEQTAREFGDLFIPPNYPTGH